MAKTVTAVVAGVMVHVLRRLSQEYLIMLTSAWTIVWQCEELSQNSNISKKWEKKENNMTEAVLINERVFITGTSENAGKGTYLWWSLMIRVPSESE